MRDNNIPTAIPMFLRSNNMTALVRILTYVWWLEYQRWRYVTGSGYLTQTLTWKSRPYSD